MGKLIAAFVMLILLGGYFNTANAQSGTVTRNRSLLGGYNYHQNGRKFSENEFLKLLEPYPQSYNLMHSARKSGFWSGVIGFMGAGLVYSQIDPFNPAQDRNTTILVTGLALFGASVPLTIKYRRQSGMALSLHNEAQFKTGYFRP